eukprot:COSAG02_NODE_5646_length_4155_cov_1.831361_2_plen_64_part_00
MACGDAPQKHGRQPSLQQSHTPSCHSLVMGGTSPFQHICEVYGGGAARSNQGRVVGWWHREVL